MTQPTPLDIETFVRKTFVIQAIQVTPQNIYRVAKWCRGKVKTEGGRSQKKFIKVEVKRALNDRQTMAYVGDWVLKAGSGYKVYTQKAFSESFQKTTEHMVKTAKNMVKRELEEDAAEDDQFDSTTQDSLPTGGRTSFISAG